MPPLSLSDRQLRMVQRAAATLPVSSRDEFMRGIASHLGCSPTDDAVRMAIGAQLAINRIPTFLCDSAKGEHR